MLHLTRGTTTLSIVAAGALVAGIGIFLATRWPFARGRVIESVERLAHCDVKARGYSTTFFPSPGCDLEEVVVRRGSVTLASVRRLRFRASWLALLTLTHQLSSVDLEGLAVRIPDSVPAPVEHGKAGRPVVASTVRADGALLEVAGASKVLRFEFRELRLRNAGAREQILFRTLLPNPEPPGELEVTGAFGPFDSGQVGHTPLSGSFTLTGANLGKYSGIAGSLSASGKFSGKLEKVIVEGSTRCPDFSVAASTHIQSVDTAFSAEVNGLTGDTLLQRVYARFGQTALAASGSITGEHGKTARVNFESEEAHVEDLLHMVSRAPVPALRGPISLKATAVLPPGEDRFLHKLQLDGRFTIRRAEFTKVPTQSRVNQLSARARRASGEHDKKVKGGDVEAPEVAADLQATVIMRRGVASLPQVSFRVPGAIARGSGTFNAISKRIELEGHVAMESTASEAAGGGWKSALLKPFNFLYKKKKSNSGAVLPVSVTGRYPRAQFHVSLKPE